MKKSFIYLICVIFISCNSDSNIKDNSFEKSSDIEIKEQVNSEIENVNYTIDELFFYQEINNGNLLATSDGKLSTQTERAMVFVPAGVGEEDVPKFEIIKHDDVHITLSDNKKITDYHLFNFSLNKDALILKYEAKNVFQLIKYVANSNTFQKVNVKEYLLQIDIKKDSVYFEDDSILVVGINKYKFNGSAFETIN